MVMVNVHKKPLHPKCTVLYLTISGISYRIVGVKATKIAISVGIYRLREDEK
jgi:hypothetical protein